MTRLLKTSGFFGLATMMTVGLYQNILLESGGALPEGMLGGHVHLGVLSILAIVLGFVVDSLGLAGRVRSVVTGLYLVGQWGIPLTLWIGLTLGYTFLMPTMLVWAVCLIATMLVMAWQTWTGDAAVGGSRSGFAPTDD